ncbi:hypothetical protein [Streptacidiphilus sp. P02-A3a]|uniref:hypothetical protein n=1 Tax=Streptacidiphilus sp. P02-A3a TaxID=2704468 RepID=UPI0015FD1D05|nr:hypothetical protein [Streptacidiphilus sp. P02-A3a]QMU70764.1 hypothetical protein GXP74_23680 [Streptacidiphilus sp. P02-A3a]
MFEVIVLLMIAVAAAAVAVLLAWHDHVVTHPRSARTSRRVEWIVDRWEQATARTARAVVELMRAQDRRNGLSR